MTKAELRAQFLDTLNNTQCTDDQADSFIIMGMRRIQRLAKLPCQETLLTYTTGEDFESIPIPNDYIGLIDMWVEGTDGGPLEKVSWPSLMIRKREGEQSTPRIFARGGGAWYLYPNPSEGTVVYVRYHAEHEDLTDEDTETALTRSYPDVLIYHSLLFAADRYEDERIDRWTAAAQQFLDEAQSQADEDEMMGKTLQVRSPYGDMEY